VGVAHASHVVKKSRFLGEAAAVHTQEAVKDFLSQVRERSPRASHYCYAYTIGSDATLREYSTDAGEPTHSAGPPILSAIRAFDLSNVICVITRYYGGINLGIGGLIRAYGRCARECFQSAIIEDRIFYQNMYLRVKYPDIGTVIALGKRMGGNVVEREFEKSL